MKDRWVLAALIPYGCLLAVGLVFLPLRMQLCLTLASTPERFGDVVQLSGGRVAVQVAVALDFVFIFSFGWLAIVMLRRADGVWVLPLIAVALDILENVLVLLFLSSPPGLSGVGWLRFVAIVKLFAYGASFVAIIWAASRPRR